MGSLLTGLKSFGGNLLDVAKRYGEMEYAPDSNPELEAAAGPQAALLRKQYDRNYRNQRAMAIRRGARWYEMDDMAAAPANEEHQSALQRAVQISDALKERRLADGRTQAIHDTISRLTDISPDQRRLLNSLPIEAQGKILASELFPKTNPSGTASAGTVTGSFKGANGNIWNIVQTGDPKDPVHNIDSGIRDDRRPSEIRTLNEYAADPSLLGTRQARGFADKYGQDAAAFQASVESTLPVIMQDSQNQIQRMAKLKEQLKDMPTGPLVGEALMKVSSEMQAINAAATETALMKIGQLKAMGISLNPITVEEMKVLFSTSAQVSNYPAANVKILERQMSILQQIIDNADKRLDWIDSGQPVLNYRTSEPNAAPAPAAHSSETAAQRAARLRAK